MQIHTSEDFWYLAHQKLRSTQLDVLQATMQSMKAGAQRGKQLTSLIWEIRLREKRVYYVQAYDVALFLTVGNKNDQQKTIDRLREKEDSFKNKLFVLSKGV